MKKSRVKNKPAVEASAPVTAAPPAKTGLRAWHWAALALGSLLAVVEVYSGALHGPFLLDDLYLPFGSPDAARLPLERWLARRPLLGLTFYWNYQVSGADPYSYHLVNVLLHWAASVLAFLLLRKLLSMAGEQGRQRDWLAIAGAAAFLLHPVQTQAVAYIVSRSDVLCTLFVFASLLVFLHYRTPRMGLAASLAVLVLFACGVLTKEQAAVLPAVFLATDLYWREDSWWRAIAKNWKLYAPVAAGGVFGVYVIRETLRFAGTAGFNMKDLRWWEYFLTQCRVIWLYIRLVLLPFGQNVDHDVAISRGLLDHGALFGLLALIAAAAGAWWIREKYPLVLFGLLTALLLFSPTSSFMPIRDVAAEHRVYAPLLGFLLMALDGVRRLRMTNGVVAAGVALLAALGFTAHARASLYGSDIAIWADTVEKSPAKVRPRFQLAYAYMKTGRCAEAESEFAKTAALGKPDMPLLVDWALSLDCLGRSEEAIARLKQAIEVEPAASPYSQLGMIYGKQGKSQEALAALDSAIQLDPNMAKAYVYRGNVLGGMGEWGKAIEEYRRALQIDPGDRDAMQNMSVAEAQLRRSR